MQSRKKYNPHRKVTRNKKAKVRATQISILGAFILVVLVSAISLWSEKPAALNYDTTVSELLKVEMPNDVREQWLVYEGFNVSFNADYHQPNYSSWVITPESVAGNVERKSSFRADDDVWGCPQLSDYKGSGYDRGHMAPAADMKWSEKAMSDSHFLTNVSPQNHTINSGRWNSLEQKCRNWVKADSTLVVICGPILSDYLTDTIGENIPVPKRFFKVVFSPYSQPPIATAFVVPNAPTDLGLEEMSMSVDAIEQITGFDFFAVLPDDIEAEVESKNSYRIFNIRTKK